MEILGEGDAVPYERCVNASTGAAPEPSDPRSKRARVAELLQRAGHPSSGDAELLAAVDAWRSARLVPRKSIPALAAAFIAELDALTVAHMVAAVLFTLVEIGLIGYASSIQLWYGYRHAAVPPARWVLIGLTLGSALAVSVAVFWTSMKQGVQALEEMG